jgi:signal transduction histidine kinase
MSSVPVRPDEIWLERERLLRLLRDEQFFGIPFRLLLFVLVPFVWVLNGRPFAPVLFFSLWVALFALALLSRGALRSVRRLTLGKAHIWLSVGYVVDALLVVMALVLDSDPRSDLYLLFVPLILKAIFLHDSWRGARLLPFLPLLAYALTLVLPTFNWRLWGEPFFVARAALMTAIAIATLYLSRGLHEAREQVRYLNLRLNQRRADLETRTQVLTQTATNLANRVLELRTLQEGMKAINASLDLDELLDIIVENAAEVFGGATCAIGLRDSEGRMRVWTRSPGVEHSLEGTGVDSPEELAALVVRQGAPVLLDNAALNEPMLTTVMAVPLVIHGEPLGALMATRIGFAPYTTDDQQRLTAFGDQAALAVKNSSLYEQVERLYEWVKERSAELEAVLHSIGDAVVVTSPEGHIRLTNPVADALLDLPNPVPPRTSLPRDIMQGRFEEHLRATLNNPGTEPVFGELTIRSSLQSDRTYQALSAPLRDPAGRPLGVVTVLRDVTAAKELEQLKSNFVSTVSHELKTPLHSIKGFVDIILSEKSTGTLTELQRDFLGTVREQTTRLERMILDLLEFNRLESGQIQLHPEPLDLTPLTESVMEQLLPVAEESGVLLRCRIPAPMEIEGDRLRVEQVLYNLVANAIKFTPPGGYVTVVGELGTKLAEITVIDTGIGIPAEEQERIFERFYQVDASQTRRFGGTGLGLAICKHIIERHGGNIWVESEPGEGSAFHFTLPLELAATRALTVDFSRLKAG